MFKLLLTAICLMLPCYSLSLEEKVGQVLMVHFNGEEANDDAKILIQDLHVGSIIYYTWANRLISPEQVRNLSAGLQKMAKIPLIIAADQEGGSVVRLKKGFTVFPGNQALNDPQEAEKCAFKTGLELLDVGVNMNLAPVVDVNTTPPNPVIRDRSYSDNPTSVIAFGEKALKGYRRSGILSSLKHFPGYGSAKVDPHYTLPILNKSKDEFEKVDLLPFKALAPKADTVMTAHLLVPAIDLDNCSTLSKPTLNLLKKEMGFQGVIISDSLVMEGVLKQCGSPDEAAVRAFNAGCDILCLGGKQLIGSGKKELTVTDMRRIHKHLVDAVKSGRISEERLDEAVEKILKLKERL